MSEIKCPKCGKKAVHKARNMCLNCYGKLQYRKHREKRLKRQSERRKLPEVKKQKHNYYVANREKLLKYCKDYNKKNKKEIRIKRFIKIHGCPPSDEYIETWKL